MAYDMEGRILEACTCDAVCPCWVGENPDGGECKGVAAWHIDKGTINGTNVAGCTIAMAVYIPDNILSGNMKALVFLNEDASAGQEEALVAAFTGKLGGPLEEFAQLIGEVVGLKRAPVEFDVAEGKGTFKFGDAFEGETQPFEGPTGKTTLVNSVFSTIPGSPAYVGKAPVLNAKVPELDIDLKLEGQNAIQGSFRFAA